MLMPSNKIYLGGLSYAIMPLMDLEEQEMHQSHAVVEQKYLKLIEISQNEKVICAIKKHPIGLVSIYFSGLFVSLAVIITTIFAGSWIQAQITTNLPVANALLLIGVLIGLLCLFVTYVAGFVYQNNILILTNEKVAQILYSNLIDRKVSQISLGELQDITVDQKGVLARILQFGTLVLETAGEQNNYNFTYTRYPQHCAKELVEAHETSIKRYGN
jgi:hypothetical protein